jgi:hypothetical protein
VIVDSDRTERAVNWSLVLANESCYLDLRTKGLVFEHGRLQSQSKLALVERSYCNHNMVYSYKKWISWFT